MATPPNPTRVVHVLDLGQRSYAPVHNLQRQAVERVRTKAASELLILVEHRPTITLGRRADASNIILDSQALERLGIEVHRIERGGDVTYHGPGQLVAYPILRLHEHLLGASDYMHRLEDVVIATLADLGIQADRRVGYIGVWVGNDKVCALGVRIMRGVTMHGLALNVDPDMSHWATIVPCGIRDGGVTSLRALLGQAPDMTLVKERLLVRFAGFFGTTLVTAEDHSPWLLPATEGARLAP